MNCRNGFGCTPLHWAASYEEDLEALRLLIKAGADVNARDDAGCTPLCRAASYNPKSEALTALIKAGADVNCRNSSGETPLMRVLSFDWYEYDPDGEQDKVKDQVRERVIRYLEAVRLLLEAGADANARSEAGDTPLICAVQENCTPEALVMLIEAGAEVNCKDTSGKTPLMWAACCSRYQGDKNDLEAVR